MFFYVLHVTAMEEAKGGKEGGSDVFFNFKVCAPLSCLRRVVKLFRSRIWREGRKTSDGIDVSHRHLPP
jgi:hypothetical protein